MFALLQDRHKLTYTKADLALGFGVSVRTVERWIARGLLKTVNATRRVLVPVAEVERFLQEGLNQ